MTGTQIFLSNPPDFLIPRAARNLFSLAPTSNDEVNFAPTILRRRWR